MVLKRVRSSADPKPPPAGTSTGEEAGESDGSLARVSVGLSVDFPEDDTSTYYAATEVSAALHSLA